jgi:hypothetical protein
MRILNLSGKAHDVRAEIVAAGEKMKSVDAGALVQFLTAELDQLVKVGAEFIGVHVVRRPHDTGSLELSVSISALPGDPTTPLVTSSGMLEEIQKSAVAAGDTKK